MRISFTRLDPERHRLSIERTDGTVAATEVETRSLLAHDLAHLAVETALATRSGYFGRVAAGASIDGTWDDPDDAETLMGIESMVGIVQSLWRSGTPKEDWPDALGRAGTTVDPELVSRIHECLRRLHGRWRATPFGEPMTVGWGPDGLIEGGADRT